MHATTSVSQSKSRMVKRRGMEINLLGHIKCQSAIKPNSLAMPN